MDSKNDPTDSHSEQVPNVEVQSSQEVKDEEQQENLDEDTEIVTMLDVLNEETELENNADAGKQSKVYSTVQYNTKLILSLQSWVEVMTLNALTEMTKLFDAKLCMLVRHVLKKVVFGKQVFV